MSKLGIPEQMAGKLRQTTVMPVGEFIASGAAQIGCQQLSELKEIEGIELTGLIPQEVQLTTPFFGAVFANSKVPKQAKVLLLFLGSPVNAQALYEAGLIPVMGRN